MDSLICLVIFTRNLPPKRDLERDSFFWRHATHSSSIDPASGALDCYCTVVLLSKWHRNLVRVFGPGPVVPEPLLNQNFL